MSSHKCIKCGKLFNRFNLYNKVNSFTCKKCNSEGLHFVCGRNRNSERFLNSFFYKIEHTILFIVYVLFLILLVHNLFILFK